MSGLPGNRLGSLAFIVHLSPGASANSDCGNMGLRVSHEFLNPNLQVPHVSFPSDDVLWFIPVLPVSLMLLIAGEFGVSPHFLAHC